MTDRIFSANEHNVLVRDSMGLVRVSRYIRKCPGVTMFVMPGTLVRDSSFGNGFGVHELFQLEVAFSLLTIWLK